ncbi:Hemerythrin HHE cation binding domain [Phanerochaete sordida]|uniref:Hemerythrin HHE cation binding domain n=1 Tax=Phanerochaete sordida TaxID=48140 RepID=A0A9P3LMP0_9APHY|nr:Hemerythrin HHE cation binding domain [Phanerochaete sordida]
MSAQQLDVAKEVKLDHDNVRDLFQRYKSASDSKQKQAIACTLIREMAIHGDAEEMSIYKEYARFGLGSEAEHNKEEHAEVKRVLYEADTKSFESADYDQVLAKAFNVFDTHAKEEEEQQLSQLASKLSAQENDKLARDFLKARKMAPTRPHPSAPQSGGAAQMAAGMPAGMADKIVEMMQGREFVDLKANHPKV